MFEGIEKNTEMENMETGVAHILFIHKELWRDAGVERGVLSRIGGHTGPMRRRICKF